MWIRDHGWADSGIRTVLCRLYGGHRTRGGRLYGEGDLKELFLSGRGMW